MSDLAAERRRLLEAAERHEKAVHAFLVEAGGNTYDIDLFFVGVANRSLHLVVGFVSAFDQWNVFSAAPLVRLQVDSLVRVSYAARAPNMHQVVEHVMAGHKFNSLKDPEGRRMTDHHLVEMAAELHPWVKHVYADSNGWIHLSRIQVLAPFELNPEGGLRIRFPMRRASVPQRFYANMLAAMAEATDDLLIYLDMWRRRKGLPSGEWRK